MQPISNTFDFSYHVDTDVYTGPLDLLLDLIQRAELDITRLSLAKVTDQYIEYIERMQSINASDISEFLVIAAKLIQIKSEALLPRPVLHEEGEEDLGESLARQLNLYRQIKNAAFWLKDREEKEIHTYLHIAKPFAANINVDLSDISIYNLINSLSNLYTSEADIKALGTVITIPKITFRRKIQSIMHDLSIQKNVSFQSLVGNDRSRLNFLIVFLAILELVKQDYIITQQNSIFGDFTIKATEKITRNDEIELSLDG
jgi:segregation and condensation protein A